MAKIKVYDGTLKKEVEIEVDNQEDPNTVSNKKKSMRSVRNIKLDTSDWCLGVDSPLTDSQKQEVITYRQQLRDWPERAEWPDEAFPIPPSFLG